jgi:hypothetical protein
MHGYGNFKASRFHIYHKNYSTLYKYLRYSESFSVACYNSTSNYQEISFIIGRTYVFLLEQIAEILYLAV